MARKTRIYILTIMFVLMLSGCTGQTNSKKSLYEHGMDVVALMEEMVKSSDYASLMSGARDLEQIRLELAAGDYTSPQAVYEIDIPPITDVLSLEESEIPDSFSDSLKKQLNNRSASVLVSLVNSRNGATALASASIYTAGKTFVSSETEENTLYLYTFPNGYPIAVLFTTGEDSTVTAAGTFLITEELDAESIEQIQDLLSEAGFPDVVHPLPE